jgi:hypothetical protein
MAKYIIKNVRSGGHDMDEIWEDNRYIATVPDGKGQETVKLIEGETAPLHAKIEKLKAENARLLAEKNQVIEFTKEKGEELHFAACNPTLFGFSTFEEISSSLVNITDILQKESE